MNHQQVTIGGFTLQTRVERADQDIEIINEVVIHDTYRIRGMKKAGFAPKTIVSVGSHIGTFEVLAHSLWPDARFVSVEPNKESFELLKENAPFTSAHNAAIFYDQGAILIDGEGSTGGCFIATKESFESLPGYDPVTKRVPEKVERGTTYSVMDTEIRSMTFEDLVRSEHLTRIDLLKLDCEGGEWGILEHLPIAGLEIGYIVGEHHARGYDALVRAAAIAVPHLTIYGRTPKEGGNSGDVGPFFSYPGLKPHRIPGTPFFTRLKRSLRKRWVRLTQPAA